MLAITRKHGESIQIGDVTVTVFLDKGQKQCRLVIDAPRTVPIWRSEMSDEGIDDVIARAEDAAREA